MAALGQEAGQAPTAVEALSARTVLTASGVALLVAAVLLVLFVLPAEYGIDPLGTGKALGLTDLAAGNEGAPAAAPDTSAPASAGDVVTIAPVLVPSPTGDAPSVRNTYIPQPGAFHADSREMTLLPGAGVEIKYNMTKGAGFVYSWTATGTVSFEFHGEPNVKPAGKEGTDYYESYELDDAGKKDGHGTFVAPSTGIHGWFWENKGAEPVKVTLITAGFYDWIFQNVDDQHTALKPMDPAAWPRHPAVPDEVLK